ncbi:MAG: hypothetical protein JOZ72_13205 [Alphaproteobacteria bacterium]|nr:hypothetical protein [Alphaproteobacteria bacterium]
MTPGPWNSLEIAKMAVSLLTPVTVALLGIYINRALKRFELAQWRSQKLVEKRLQIYDSIAPDLNDLLCYFTYRGAWRDFDPPQIVALKRKIDKSVNLAVPLFSEDFHQACTEFLGLCFKTFTGWGKDAKLKTKYHRRRESRTDWRNEWANCFANDDEAIEPSQIAASYKHVMAVFARDIGVNNALTPPAQDSLPFNVG